MNGFLVMEPKCKSGVIWFILWPDICFLVTKKRRKKRKISSCFLQTQWCLALFPNFCHCYHFHMETFSSKNPPRAPPKNEFLMLTLLATHQTFLSLSSYGTIHPNPGLPSLLGFLFLLLMLPSVDLPIQPQELIHPVCENAGFCGLSWGKKSSSGPFPSWSLHAVSLQIIHCYKSDLSSLFNGHILEETTTAWLPYLQLHLFILPFEACVFLR